MDHDYPDRAPERARAPRARNDGQTRAADGSGLAAAVGNAAFSRLVRDGSPRPAVAAAGSAVLKLAVRRSAIARAAQASQGAGPLDPEIGAAIESRRGAGSPLAEPVRAEMEGHLGADLSAVRIHTDSAAATLNRAVQAEAFTTGNDVFFSPGRYDPASSNGRGLLAHELTHVVQQSSGAGGPGGTVSHPDDPAEQEAAAVGAQVAREAKPDEEDVPAS